MYDNFNSIECVENSNNECISLWRAVILQAIMDLISNNKARAECRIAKEEAHSWLTKNSTDFRTVCNLARFNTQYIQKKAYFIIQNKTRYDPLKIRCLLSEFTRETT